MLSKPNEKTGDALELTEGKNVKGQLKQARDEGRLSLHLKRQVDRQLIVRENLSRKQARILREYEDDTLRLRQNNLTRAVGRGRLHPLAGEHTDIGETVGRVRELIDGPPKDDAEDIMRSWEEDKEAAHHRQATTNWTWWQGHWWRTASIGPLPTNPEEKWWHAG